MIQLLLASLGFIPWALYIILTYYSTNYSSIPHIEAASGYSGYLIGIGVIYAIWKIASLSIQTREVKIGFWHIVGFSLVQIVVVAMAYTSTILPNVASERTGSIFFQQVPPSSLNLIANILLFLLYPLFLGFLWRALGYSILRYIREWDTHPLRIRIGAEISVGLGVFSIIIMILGGLGILNLTALVLVLLVLTLISYKGWIETYHDIRTRSVRFEQHNADGGVTALLNPHLLTVEFGFMVVSFLIGVSLVLAIRPMPIGWDDLGVYMNFPRMMALSGSLLQGAGMYTWQLITSTGYLWNDIATQAFYVNQLGGILSMIIIISVLSALFEFPHKKYFLSLPVILGIVYYFMPMTIFQQAKDMKLDPALMAVSVSAFGLLWYTLRNHMEKKGFWITILVAGCIVGLAFSIKFTTLMFVIAALGYIAYHFIGLSGFLGFFFLFLGIFTGGNLWSKMNIWMPLDNTSLIHTIALVCLAIGVVGIIGGIYTHSVKNVRSWAIASGVFLGGILLTLSPWLIKNMLEGVSAGTLKSSTVVDTMLNGAGGNGLFDTKNYSAIYSPEEYKAKRDAQAAASITSDGKSLNEDFSRYFGQESGINNYMKLPANLTFQKNQAGEFTEITYIFLALVPAMLLFVTSRRGIFAGIVALSTLWYLIYAFFPTLISGSTTIAQQARTIHSATELDHLRDSATLTNLLSKDPNTGGFTRALAPILASPLYTVTSVPDTAKQYPSNACIGGAPSAKNTNGLSDIALCPKIDLAFGVIDMPLGYGVMISMVLLFFVLSHFLIDTRNPQNSRMKEIFAFISIYGFLFLVSAFGIVWYGVFVYFLLLAMIGFGALSFVAYDEPEDADHVPRKFLVQATLSAIFVLFVATYIVRSAFPHGWNNLTGGGFGEMNEYKYDRLSANQSIFAYRGDYMTSIATMNLKDPSQVVQRAASLAKTESLKKLFTPDVISHVSPLQLHQVLMQLLMQIQAKKVQAAQIPALKQDLSAIGNELYSSILNPRKDEANNKPIYRIGTFMTYLIQNNRARYIDDSLVFEFDTFFYDPTPETAIERMRKLGVGYLLVDLNAATIDRDPRRALTTRYEHLLATMRARNLRLVDTDNSCLRLAISQNTAGKFATTREFLDIAGTNYESYDGGRQIHRGVKQNNCANLIVNLLNENAKNNTPLPEELEDIKKSLAQTQDRAEQQNIIKQFAGKQSYFALFEVLDTPTTPLITPPTVSVGTGATSGSGQSGSGVIPSISGALQ